jgi:cyanophycinase-like exopeptidase
VTPQRIPGNGWIVLVGGGEFTFEETLDADAAWVEKLGPGPVGFVPAASGSLDYGAHFANYFTEVFGREVVTLPIYRGRDARRGKNAERIAECAAVYLGGGVTDHLLEALAPGTPVLAALEEKLAGGGIVVAIAAAASALGVAARSIRIGETIPGIGWLPGGVVETNFVTDHDRRLRKLLTVPGASWGLGIPTGDAVLLGPEGAVEYVGEVFGLADPAGPLEPLGEPFDDEEPALD